MVIFNFNLVVQIYIFSRIEKTMKRWILCCCLGIMAAGYFPELPGFVPLVLLLSIFTLSFRFRSIRLLGAFSMGLLWGLAYGWFMLQSQLLVEDEGKDLWVTGRVTGIPKHYEHSRRFDFLVDQVNDETGKDLNRLLKKIRINWYQLEHPVVPGEYWRFKVRLKKPHGFANPGGFNYETWLFRQGIGATGYVRSAQTSEPIKNAYPQIGHYLDRWRYFIIKRLNEKLATEPHRDLFLALTLGEKSEITPAQWQLFSASGTNHLFVISGLHIGFIAGLVYAVGLWLGRLTMIRAPVWTVQQTAACIAISAATFYALLAGFSLPTQRALIMIVALLSGQLVKREVEIWRAYCFALLLVLLNDPLAAETRGFWLSFLAVAALIYAYQGRTRIDSIGWRWIRPQWIVFIALIPVLLVSFQQFSLVSPVANTLAVPIVGFILVPLSLLAALLFNIVPSLAGTLFSIFGFILEYLLVILKILTNHPHATRILNPGSLPITLAVLGILILLSPRGLPARWLGGLCLLPLFIANHKITTTGEFSLTVLDVGQGLSAVIETKNHSLIYDVGAKYSRSFNMADAVILPYLKTVGIERANRLVISHSDNDHAGALPVLLEKLHVEKVITGTPMEFRDGITHQLCHSGFSWAWDGVQFQLMKAETGAWSNENNQSCVLKISSGRRSVLLTGDIEREAEASLIAQFPEKLDSVVMIVPHHGSLTSSTEKFLDRVSPDYAVFTTGYQNRFGHPHAKVVERYQRLGTSLLNTVSSGAITITFDKENAQPIVKQHRRTFNRYWY